MVVKSMPPYFYMFWFWRELPLLLSLTPSSVRYRLQQYRPKYRKLGPKQNSSTETKIHLYRFEKKLFKLILIISCYKDSNTQIHDIHDLNDSYKLQNRRIDMIQNRNNFTVNSNSFNKNKGCLSKLEKIITFVLSKFSLDVNRLTADNKEYGL